MVPAVSASRKGRICAISLCCVALFAAFLGFFSARWFVSVYGRIGFDSILYTLNSSLGGVEPELLVGYLLKALLPCAVSTALVIYLAFFRPRKKPTNRAFCNR